MFSELTLELLIYPIIPRNGSIHDFLVLIELLAAVWLNHFSAAYFCMGVLARHSHRRKRVVSVSMEGGWLTLCVFIHSSRCRPWSSRSWSSWDHKRRAHRCKWPLWPETWPLPSQGLKSWRVRVWQGLTHTKGLLYWDHLAIDLSFYLSIYWSICRSIVLSISLSIFYSSIHLPIYVWIVT